MPRLQLCGGCCWLGLKQPWPPQAMLLRLKPLPPAVLLREGDSRYIDFGASCAWRLMLVMIYLMCFFQAPITAQRH